jgi:multifunctional methyltransferase subunit TRM112
MSRERMCSWKRRPPEKFSFLHFTKLTQSSLVRRNRTTRGYPLLIEATKVVVEESPVNREMIEAILPKLDYSALVAACQQLAAQATQSEAEGIGPKTVPTLPDQVPEAPLDDDTVAMLHRVLFDIHVLGGHLVCPDTGRRFPINDGIPNMILHEDEL